MLDLFTVSFIHVSTPPYHPVVRVASLCLCPYLYDVFACLVVQRLVHCSVCYIQFFPHPLIVLALYTPHQSLLSTAAALARNEPHPVLATKIGLCRQLEFS